MLLGCKSFKRWPLEPLWFISFRAVNNWATKSLKPDEVRNMLLEICEKRDANMQILNNTVANVLFVWKIYCRWWYQRWAYGKHTVSCHCLESIFVPDQQRYRSLSVFLDLTSSHCCGDLSTTRLRSCTALLGCPGTELSDRSPSSYPIPIAATHSWTVIIKERSRGWHIKAGW